MFASGRRFRPGLNRSPLPILFMVAFLGEVSSAVGRKAGDPIYPSMKNISCYVCHSEFDGANCYDAAQHNGTFKTCTQSIAKGGGCAVYRLDTSEQSSGVRTHSIERRCADSCQPDCVIVGERHKLHLCTSCCNQTLCNTDNSAQPLGRQSLAFSAFGLKVSVGYPVVIAFFVAVTAMDRLAHELFDV